MNGHLQRSQFRFPRIRDAQIVQRLQVTRVLRSISVQPQPRQV